MHVTDLKTVTSKQRNTNASDAVRFDTQSSEQCVQQRSRIFLPTQRRVTGSSPAPVTPVGPRRSQRVVHQPERTLSSYKTTPTYASAKSVPTANTHAAAHAPGNPVPAPPQAQMSSYVSRMRTGSTLLMQPISTSSHAAAAASLALNAMGAQRRRGGVINYAEGLSDDDFGDSEDDEEFTKDKNGASGSKRSTPRLGSGPGSSSFRVGSPASGTPQREVRQELDKSYLGLIPPSRYFSSKPVSKSRHDYPCVDPLILPVGNLLADAYMH